MLTVSNIRRSTPERAEADYAHPFYRDSIRRLFEVEVSREMRAPTRNRQALASALRSVMRSGQAEYRYLLDVRLQEELGSPAPQYEILYDLGLRQVTPVCVHGDGADTVKEALHILTFVMKPEDKALCLVSRLSSASWQNSKEEFIFAFELQSDGAGDGDIVIEGEKIKWEEKTY